MLLETLTLEDFGPYRGRHVFDLAPAPGRPVVLFVGLNGAGKTTLLQALELVFYGPRAPEPERCALRGSYLYGEYLSDCTHHGVFDNQPNAPAAAVEVAFRASRGGEERRWTVRRSWRRATRPPLNIAVGHRVEVTMDGRPEPALAAAWDAEIVDEFLPRRLASLFFFDGERIEEWSDPDAIGTLRKPRRPGRRVPRPASKAPGFASRASSLGRKPPSFAPKPPSLANRVYHRAPEPPDLARNAPRATAAAPGLARKLPHPGGRASRPAPGAGRLAAYGTTGFGVLAARVNRADICLRSASRPAPLPEVFRIA